jgi:hypothetical protein
MTLGALIFALWGSLMIMIAIDGLSSAMPFIWERVKRPVRFAVSAMPTLFMIYTVIWLIRGRP